jgi:hypothetical protein
MERSEPAPEVRHIVTDLGGTQDERPMLDGFLDWNRAVVEGKVAGLTREQATRVTTPSGVTLLGLVRHLAWAEDLWFADRFFGESQVAIDIEESFVLGPDDTVDSVLAAYRAACERSRSLAAGAALDALSVSDHPVYGRVTLRWVLLHLIEETARHAGHLDILREQTDGRTGD